MPLNDTEQRLCAAIAKRDRSMRQQLARDVAIPTGGDFTPGLDEYRGLVVEQLEALEARITTVPGTPRPQWLEHASAAGRATDREVMQAPPVVLAERAARSRGPRILIAGHLDTVHDPYGSFRKLTTAPDGRTATGPGVVDMKGGILIAIHALEALAECGVEVNWTFLLNSDEETGSFHSFEAITQAARDHDIGLALEPALPDGSLVVERMGAGQFKVEVFGRAAHVGRDFVRGVSAVSKLGEVLVQLAGMAEPQLGRIVNVGPLQGGAATNIVADYAACWGNVRFADGESARWLERGLVALATAPDQLPRVTVHHLINRPAKPLTEEVRRLAEKAREAASDLGQELRFGSTGGVCDGNIMQAAGLPTIDTLGVRGGNLHRTDEFIELSSLVGRCQLLAVLLARLSHGSN